MSVPGSVPRLLALAAVALLLVTAGAPGASAQSDGTASFAFDSTHATTGDVVEFEVETGGQPDDVWVSVRDDVDDYEVTLRLADVRDHGEPIGVRWDTHRALNESHAGFSATNADVEAVDVEGQRAESADHLTGDERHDVELESYVSEEAIAAGDFEDVSVVSLESHEAPDVSVGTVPADEHDVDADIDALLDGAAENGTATDGDLLVVDVADPGLFHGVESTPAGLAAAGLHLRLVGPGTSFEDGPVLDATALERVRVEVLPDEGRLVAVVSGEELAAVAGNGTEAWSARFVREAGTYPYVADGTDDVAEAGFDYAATGTRGAFDVTADAPDTAHAGTPANLSVVVDNEGDVADEATVAVTAGETRLATETVSLEPGEDWSATYDLPAPEPGVRSWRVETRDDAARGEYRTLADLEFGGHRPRPHEGSVRYYDVDGDGEVTQGDVVHFFRHQHRESLKRYPEYFDFSDSGAVGHGDVIALFEAVATDGGPWAADAAVVDAPESALAGDAVDLGLEVSDSRAAWVHLAADGADYEATAKLVDVRAEHVDLRVHTDRLGNGSLADALAVSNATLDPGASEERGSVVEDAGPVPGGTEMVAGATARLPHAPPEEEARVSLPSLALGDLEVNAAPANAVPSTPGGVHEDASPASEVALGDRLVLEVGVRGNDRALPEDPTDFGGRGLDVTLQGPDPIVGERPGGSVPDVDDYSYIVPEPEADRLYVLLDTDDLSESGIGRDWTVTATVDGDAALSGVAEENLTASAEFELVERALAFAEERVLEDRVPVAPGPNAGVEVVTNAAPGTLVTVWVAHDGSVSDFSARVDEDGTASIPLDLDGAEVGDRIQAIRAQGVDGERVEAPGLVVPPGEVLREDVVVRTVAPEAAAVGEDATLEATVTNEGDAAGYALGLVEVEGEAVHFDALHLEPGEERTLTADVDTSAADTVEWTVRADADRADGSVVVRDQRATVFEPVVGGAHEESLTVPIDADREPETVYALLRSADGSYERTVAIDDPGDTAWLTWSPGSGSGPLYSSADDVEVLERVGDDPAPGEYELYTSTRRPVVEAADDVTTVVVSRGNVTDVHGVAAGDEVSLSVGADGLADVDELGLERADGTGAATFDLGEANGTFDLTWNTREAGGDFDTDAGFSADGADLELTAYAGNLGAPGTYSLALRDDGVPVEQHRIEVVEPDVGAVRLLTAPGAAREPFADAVDRRTVAARDLVVAEVGATGLYGQGTDDLAALTDAGLTLALQDGGGDAEANLTELDVVDVRTEPERGRTLLAIDPASVPEIAPNQTWTVTAGLDGDDARHLPDGETRTTSASFDYEERRVDLVGAFEDDRLVLPPAEDARVVAQTNVAPGTEADLRVNLPRDFRTASTTVEADGTAAAEIHLAGQSEGTQLNDVRLRVPDSDNQAQAGGVIGDPEEPARFEVDASALGTVYEGDDAALDVVIENTGDVAGTAQVETAVGDATSTTEVDLEAGETWDVSHSVPTDEPDEIDWRVETRSDRESGSVEVLSGFPNFAIDASAPASAALGDDAHLEVEIVNDGTAAGTASIGLQVGDRTIEDQVYLKPRDSWSTILDVPTEETGAVSWSVDTQHDAKSGTVEVSEP